MAKQKPKKALKKSTSTLRVSSTVPTWVDRANTFLSKHAGKVMLTLMALSLSLSTIYYIQGRGTPVDSYYKWENSDMSFFHEWAMHIAFRDAWCDTVLHPYHDWHDIFATETFSQFPEVQAKYVNAAGDSSSLALAKRQFVNDVYKGKTYHQEPLYAYMMAATYRVFGTDHKWIYFWQFILAAFTSVLVYLIGKRMFNPLTGVLASLFFTMSGAIMVYQMVLLRTTLTNFLTALLLYLFLRVLEKPDNKWMMAFGIASGLSLMTQTYLILFLIPAWLWLFWTYRKSVRQIAFPVGVYFVSVLFFLLPLFIRNLKAGVPVTATASNGSITYIPANVQQSGPMEAFYIHPPTLARIMHESEGKMLPAITACLRTFDNIGSFWNIYRQKIGGMFMWYEIPNNVSYYMFKEFAPILGDLPVRYFFIAPLALAGIGLGIWKYRWKMVPVLIMLLASAAPLIIANNLARYRTPFVMLMCILAAYCVIAIMTYVLTKKWKILLAGLAMVAIAFLFTINTAPPRVFVYNANDFGTVYREHFHSRLTALQTGSNEEFLGVTSEMMDYIPDYFYEVPLQQPIYRRNEAEASRIAAQLMNIHLETLQLMNKTQEINYYQERVNTLIARADRFGG